MQLDCRKETLDMLVGNGILVDPTESLSDAWCYSEVAIKNRVGFQISHFYIVGVPFLTVFPSSPPPYSTDCLRQLFPASMVFEAESRIKTLTLILMIIEIILDPTWIALPQRPPIPHQILQATSHTLPT